MPTHKTDFIGGCGRSGDNNTALSRPCRHEKKILSESSLSAHLLRMLPSLSAGLPESLRGGLFGTMSPMPAHDPLRNRTPRNLFPRFYGALRFGAYHGVIHWAIHRGGRVSSFRRRGTLHGKSPWLSIGYRLPFPHRIAVSARIYPPRIPPEISAPFRPIIP